MTVAQLTPWVVFLVGAAALLVLDIGILGRRSATMTTRSALAWSAIWVSLSLSFALAIWAWRGAVASQEYLAGYLIEESLSIDNLFVFMLVFGSLGIALPYQRKVLFWGIFGAIVLRGAFILVGVSVLERFEWVMYLFGALLVFAVDSVPAVLAVSNDAFVVFTSNVAAILGLRALYFALAGSLQRFKYLSWGLAIVLGFVGVKMFLSRVIHIPIYLSLTVIVVAVGATVLFSLWMTRGGTQPPPARTGA